MVGSSTQPRNFPHHVEVTGSLSKRRPRAPRSGVWPAMIHLFDLVYGSGSRTGAAGPSLHEDLGGEASAPAESALFLNDVSGGSRSAPIPGADPGAVVDCALLYVPFATIQSARSLHILHNIYLIELASELPEGRESAGI